MTRPISLAVLALLVVGLGVAEAQAPLSASGAWVREPVPGRTVTAAFVVIENAGAADLQIVGATCDAAGIVEMHEMVRSGDMMKMAPVKSIAVPAKGKVELKPGGLHLMLFELNKPLKEGDTVNLTLTTDTGAKVQAAAAVKKFQMKP
jgi:periplasmic copper chaperone A